MALRPIRWLHISDIHMQAGDTWSQDLVLNSLCKCIAQQHADGLVLDFILATGDLTFSGKPDEFRLTEDFFSALGIASGVAKDCLFCIPGNHDIDRERQKIAFLGARTFLQNEAYVDSLLAGGEELGTLLKREENYRYFQTTYFGAQSRTHTADGLGYVSCLTIDSVRIVVAAFDSAWLAEGGLGDYGRLLIGERQVINALERASSFDPHIIIGMAHHPFHHILEFDRQMVQSRIQRACRFFHCGHLHEPDSAIGGNGGTNCLTFSAGASFETRQTHNSYSIVKLDLLHALCTVDIVRYNPRTGLFLVANSNDYRVELPPIPCSVTELADELRAYSGKLAFWPHYLAALLLDQKDEFLISAPTSYTFGSFPVIQGLQDCDLKQMTSEFMSFKNALRIFYGKIPLSEIFAKNGAAVERYGDFLHKLCAENPGLKSRLLIQEEDAKALANTQPSEGRTHTNLLLAELAADEEWTLLRYQAERHTESANLGVAIYAKRMLALSLAHSEELTDREKAIELYRLLLETGDAGFADIGNLAILLSMKSEEESLADAKRLVVDGIRKYPEKADYFSEIGQRIIEATGDGHFRRQIEAITGKRG